MLAKAVCRAAGPRSEQFSRSCLPARAGIGAAPLQREPSPSHHRLKCFQFRERGRTVMRWSESGGVPGGVHAKLLHTNGAVTGLRQRGQTGSS